MKRYLAFAVAFVLVAAMVLAFLPAAPAYAASDNAVTRRALIIGNTNYAQSPLTAPAYDARHMQELFRQMNYTGTMGAASEQGAMPDENIVRKTDRTRGQMLQDIAAAFAGADEDDVSYFYYSGHGSVYNSEAQLVGVDLNYLSLSDLKEALDAVQGIKVVILDSCFSGGFVNKAKTPSQALVDVAGNAVSSGIVFNHNNPKKKTTAPERPSVKKGKSGDMDELFPSSLKKDPPEDADSLSTQFNGSVDETFSKASKYLDGGNYIVLTAAANNQYSYEFNFNAAYGPSFIMNGVDFAERNSASSGEFTGMLVAGAGIVEFTSTFGQLGLLADFNEDGGITPAELEYYLRGSVMSSDVQLYTDEGIAEDTVLFRPAGTPANSPRVSLPGGIAPVTSDPSATSIGITINPPAGLDSNLVIYRYPKETDGSGANGYVDELAVETFPNVSAGTLTWDGMDDEGQPVADGTYHIVLETGADLVQEGDPPFLYPGAAVVLERGQTAFTKELTLAADGSSYAVTDTADIASDGAEDCVWFMAPATGAMNVYADLSALSPGLTAICTLHDGEGNLVNYSTAQSGKSIYLPFAVKLGSKYYLKFFIMDTPDKPGDTGSFSYTLKLNNAIDGGDTASGGANQYEAWLIKPSTAAAGKYTIQSSGQADTVATLVDDNQITRIASNDDFCDGHFLIKTPMLQQHGYLLVVRNYDFEQPKTYSVCVSAPGSDPVFNTAGIDEMPGVDDLQSFPVADAGGDPTYLVINTHSNPEKWTFTTSQSEDGPDVGVFNDPYLLVMDGNYNLIGNNDDYNMIAVNPDSSYSYYDYSAACSVMLEPNSTYILSIRSSSMSGYDYTVYPYAMEMTASDLAVKTPKAVFMDNGGLSLDRYGNVASWGNNEYGELGLGTVNPSPTPQQVILPYLDQAVDVWASDTMAFARIKYEQYCYWGMPYSAYGSSIGSIAPTMLYCLDGMDIADIQCGAETLALIRTHTGEIYMLDLELNAVAPVELPGVAQHMVKQIIATDSSFLALTYDGKLFSWGENWTGECGVGSTGAVNAPAQVSCNGAVISQIAAGWDHVLALTQGGEVYGWGFNGHSELGLGTAYTKTSATAPQKVSGGDMASHEIKAVYAGANHSMCVDASGDAYGWGINLFGELGLGHAAKVPDPEKITFYNAGGPDSISVMSMAAGMMSVFAQDSSHNVYGYGSNMDYQLAREGLAPNGITKLMTLPGPVFSGHTSELAAVHTNSGYVVMEDDSTVSVYIDEYTEEVYLVPEPIDGGATYTINDASVRGITVTVPNPGNDTHDSPAKIKVVSDAGEKLYTLIVYRDPCTNNDLRSLAVSAGASLSPAFSPNANRYTVTIPETMPRVTVTPAVDGYGAHYYIDSNGRDTPKTYTLAAGATQYGVINVVSQAGYDQEYLLTIRRPLMLTALSATPMVSGYPSLSPGGTNRMRINYSLSYPSAVKIEVKKGSAWYTVMTRTETTAGAKYWDWDGKVAGKYLLAGTYTLRVTPVYGGTACVAKTLTVKLLKKPSVYIQSLTPTTFKATGSSKLSFKAKWTVLGNVKVEIVTSSGKYVCTVWEAANQAPATKTLYWYGKNSKGALVAAGTYKVKVTCGSVVVYKTFRLKR